MGKRETDPLDRALVWQVAANVRRLAEARGLTLAHLADRAGIGRTTMWRLLDVNKKGPTDPRLSTVAALARTLEVPIVELLEEPPAWRQAA